MYFKRKTTVAVAALAAFFAFGATAEAAITVHVDLWDKMDGKDMSTDMGYGMAHAADAKNAPMGVKVSIPYVPAGQVTFAVKNSSPSLIHEMIVMPLKNPSKAIPYDAKEKAVNEDEAGDLGEVSELDPGASGSLTLTLKPGEYLLYCNVPGHFASGMWTTIKVH